jgi:hypothetical protein
MNPRFGPWAAFVAMAASLPGVAPAKDPYFGFVTSSLQQTASGISALSCVRGEHPRGVEVALLYEDSSTACHVRTGALADSVAGGPCTILVDAAKCAEGPFLAVVGSRPARYRRLEVDRTREPKELALLDATVKSSGALERLLESAPGPARPRGPMKVDQSPFEVVRLRGVRGSPSFVRYGVTHEGRHQDDGPVVAVIGRKAVEAVGPVGGLGDGLELDGKIYVLLWTGCFDCGWNQASFFALEGGGLRLLRRTSEAAL